MGISQQVLSKQAPCYYAGGFKLNKIPKIAKTMNVTHLNLRQFIEQLPKSRISICFQQALLTQQKMSILARPFNFRYLQIKYLQITIHHILPTHMAYSSILHDRSNGTMNASVTVNKGFSKIMTPPVIIYRYLVTPQSFLLVNNDDPWQIMTPLTFPLNKMTPSANPVNNDSPGK